MTALNGPVVGLSAALVACSDFIYCVPYAYPLTPFSSLDLVTEGVASHFFPKRMGAAKASEALIMSHRITADELLNSGVVNKMFDFAQDETQAFVDAVLKEIDDRLGEHLNGSSILRIKNLMWARESRDVDAQSVEELFEGLERLASGIPAREFERIRRGEKRHKL